MHTTILFNVAPPALSTHSVSRGIALGETGRYPASSLGHLRYSGGGFDLQFGKITRLLAATDWPSEDAGQQFAISLVSYHFPYP
jgi:hypothetical protein